MIWKSETVQISCGNLLLLVVEKSSARATWPLGAAWLQGEEAEVANEIDREVPRPRTGQTTSLNQRLSFLLAMTTVPIFMARPRIEYRSDAGHLGRRPRKGAWGRLALILQCCLGPASVYHHQNMRRPKQNGALIRTRGRMVHPMGRFRGFSDASVLEHRKAASSTPELSQESVSH